VRHQGQEMKFDWSGTSRDIKWAAFYSDCEHEVLEITSGHRVTLTYNLYMRHGLGEMAGHSEALDAHQLPIYKEVKDALAMSDFMAEGKNNSFPPMETYLNIAQVAPLASTVATPMLTPLTAPRRLYHLFGYGRVRGISLFWY
jgi:hypothetical protein